MTQLITIIIPTYNEQDSIETTITNLQIYIQNNAEYNYLILIFDSHSTDTTINKVKALQSKFSNIILLEETHKSGLGSAYVQAMQYAMDEIQSDIVFEYDADGSHKPNYIPDMLTALKTCDCVVGSRYVPGGSIDNSWSWHRKFLSKAASVLSQIFLSRRYKDYTSGFRATKTHSLKQVDLKNLLSKQYAYKIHLFWALHLLGANIKEFPIEFTDRKAGYSKLPKNNIFDSLIVLFKLRLYKMRRFIKMSLCGLAGMSVQFILFNLLRLHLHEAPANSLAIEAAIITNFFVHNAISFRDFKFSRADKLTHWLYKLGKFNLLSLFSLFLQTSVMYAGITALGSSFLIANSLLILGMGLGSISNYLFYKNLVWKVAKT